MGQTDRRTQRILIFLLIGALIFAGAPVSAAPLVQTDAGRQYTVGDCSRIDSSQLRSEIEAHVLAVLQNEATPIDIDAIVDRAWIAVGMDAAIDYEVARAVDSVRTSEDYLNRLISGWWGEKAEEYAERIANDAFGSPGFRAKLEELSVAIGADVARQIEAQFAQAASVALLCLQAYVGEQYSDTFFTLFAKQVQLETEALELNPLATPSISALTDHRLALAGVGTIIATQLIYRLSQKLGEKLAQRVAGRVVGRILGRAGSSFIPIAGWVVGIGMIVYDLWEGGEGALPQIQEGLQSEEVKRKIRQEIADAVRDDLPEQASLIALETAVSLTEQWQGFCGVHEYVCQIAEENADFRRLLQEVTLDELESVAGLVSFYMRQLGRAELDRALADGSLSLLLAMPDAAFTILSETYSTAETLAWAALAGEDLGLVAEWGIHRRAEPDEFTPATFAALLTLGGEGVQKVLALPSQKRAVLLALDGEMLAKLVAEQSVGDLDWLAGYLLFSGQNTQPLAQETAQPDMQTPVVMAAPTVQPDALAVVQDVAAGRISVEALRRPPGADVARSEPTVAPTLLPIADGAAASSEAPGSPVAPLLWGLLLVVVVGGAAVGGAVWWRRRRIPGD